MARSEGARLTIRGGILNGTTIRLSGSISVLGRQRDNDIVIKDKTVSRRHALIAETPRGFVLRDLESRNGTYVNDGEIGDVDHVLRTGSRIRLGSSDVTLAFTPVAA